MNSITFKRLGIAYAIFLGALFFFEKCHPQLSQQDLQIGLTIVNVFNFVIFSLALFPAAFWTIGHFNQLAARNKNRQHISLKRVIRFNKLFCWSAAAWIWMNLLLSHFNSVFLSKGDFIMTQFSPNPVILVLQCAFLVIVIALAVLFSIVLIKEIDDTLPSIIPRRLRLPFWFAAVLLFWRFAPDIFPPVMEFIHIKLNILTKLAADTFAAEPFTVCCISFCLGLFAGMSGVAASSLKALLIMTERHRKGMFEELDELIARCPCRSEEKAAGSAASCDVALSSGH